MRAKARWIVVVMLAAAAPLVGQQGPGARGPRGQGGGAAGPGVERNIDLALARAEALGLDDAKVQELRAMREELAQVQEGLDRGAAEFRTRARAQDRELREARREQALALRQERQEALQPFQERFESALTEAQRTQLRSWVRESAVRGMRPGRGQGRPGMQRGEARNRVPPGDRGRRPAGRPRADRPFVGGPGAQRPLTPGGGPA